MFFTSARKKLARETAESRIACHTTLLALWTLLHAGIIDAMRDTKEGIEPGTLAAATAMEPRVLEALLKFLAAKGLVAESEGRYLLSATGSALMEHEAGSLNYVYAHQPVM